MVGLAPSVNNAVTTYGVWSAHEESLSFGRGSEESLPIDRLESLPRAISLDSAAVAGPRIPAGQHLLGRPGQWAGSRGKTGAAPESFQVTPLPDDAAAILLVDPELPVFVFGVARDAFGVGGWCASCLLYTSPSPRDATLSRMPSSA